jgi:2-methylaconitate cis-trans-isomerase PrpF
VTIVSAGLPNILIAAASLQVDPTLSAMELDNDAQLRDRLERIRIAAAQHAGLNLSAASPKIVVVGPPVDYTTSGGDRIAREDFDILVRAISSQNFHRTVPVRSLCPRRTRSRNVRAPRSRRST